MQHDSVAHDDRVHVGVTGEFGEHPGGNLDRDRPLGHGAGPIGGGVGVGVDDHHELGASRPADTGGPSIRRDQRMAGEELLLLERIGRTPLRNRLANIASTVASELGAADSPR